MKTYTKTEVITKPRLIIHYDQFAESPREWTNLGYFITIDRGNYSPDRIGWLETIVKEAGDEAGSQDEHLKLITEGINSRGEEKVLAIYPVVKYEHSGVVYRLGTTYGYDYSNNGFYIVTDLTANQMGLAKGKWEQAIKEELATYTKWYNGEVKRFTLYDEQGELIDSCGGFYDLESIKEALPKEWADEDLSAYLKD